jgi:UDP-glucuronate decarboxylase
VIALAQRELGWQPRVALEQGLDATIAYFQEAIN